MSPKPISCTVSVTPNSEANWLPRSVMMGARSSSAHTTNSISSAGASVGASVASTGASVGSAVAGAAQAASSKLETTSKLRYHKAFFFIFFFLLPQRHRVSDFSLLLLFLVWCRRFASFHGEVLVLLFKNPYLSALFKFQIFGHTVLKFIQQTDQLLLLVFVENTKAGAQRFCVFSIGLVT